MSTAHKLIDLGLGSHSSYSFESDARVIPRSHELFMSHFKAF